MKNYFNDVRKPFILSPSRKFIYSGLLLPAGIILGILSKMLDETAGNLLPHFLELMDLRNFFSRMGIWLFLAVLISVYGNSPVRSAINVFVFFVGFVSSYYLYTEVIAGFSPKSYMMIWVVMTSVSTILAFVCWYAKGKGLIAIIISSIIVMMISRQTFAFGFWYFDIKNILEFILWIAMIFVLYQSPKQLIKVVLIGLLLFFLTAQINLLDGMM